MFLLLSVHCVLACQLATSNLEPPRPECARLPASSPAKSHMTNRLITIYLRECSEHVSYEHPLVQHNTVQARWQVTEESCPVEFATAVLLPGPNTCWLVFTKVI